MHCSYRFLKLARKVALKSSEHYRHGAVLVKGGCVISTGFNSNNKMNRLSKLFFPWPTLHAEVSCLMGLHPDVIRNSVMYVYRIKRCGEIGYSAPCARCNKALVDLNVKRVVYSIEEAPYFQIEEIS